MGSTSVRRRGDEFDLDRQRSAAPLRDDLRRRRALERARDDPLQIRRARDVAEERLHLDDVTESKSDAPQIAAQLLHRAAHGGLEGARRGAPRDDHERAVRLHRDVRAIAGHRRQPGDDDALGRHRLRPSGHADGIHRHEHAGVRDPRLDERHGRLHGAGEPLGEQPVDRRGDAVVGHVHVQPRDPIEIAARGAKGGRHAVQHGRGLGMGIGAALEPSLRVQRIQDGRVDERALLHDDRGRAPEAGVGLDGTERHAGLRFDRLRHRWRCWRLRGRG